MPESKEEKLQQISSPMQSTEVDANYRFKYLVFYLLLSTDSNSECCPVFSSVPEFCKVFSSPFYKLSALSSLPSVFSLHILPAFTKRKNVNRNFLNLSSFKNAYIKFKYLTNDKYQSNNLFHRLFHLISFTIIKISKQC